MGHRGDLRQVSVNGVDFAYFESGPPDAPLVLCLHGFPDTALTWEHLLGDLAAAGFRAVAPFMRGYHPSDPAPDGNYELAALAADACGLADALAGDRPAHLVGHDLGAVAAYPASAHRPDRFSRVVTLGVPPSQVFARAFMERPDQLRRSWYIFFFQNPLADIAVPYDDFAFVEMLWREWSPGYEPDERYLRAVKDALDHPGGLQAALGYYRCLFDPPEEPEPRLWEVRASLGLPVPVPSLYLHGRDDGCVGFDLFRPEDLDVAYSGGVEVEVVDGAGHFLHLEQPDRVNRRIIDFLTA